MVGPSHRGDPSPHPHPHEPGFRRAQSRAEEKKCQTLNERNYQLIAFTEDGLSLDVRVDAENNLILVKGAVPGPKKSLVTIKESVKTSK